MRLEAALTPAQALLARQITEDQLGENIRALCRATGWRFLWLRRTQHSSAGILDLLLIPVTQRERRHVLFREIKGYRRDGSRGRLTLEQEDTIVALRMAGEDAGAWRPEDWISGEVERELT